MAGSVRAEEAALFRNSLGMEFRVVAGTHVRFSVWETRVADWDAFLKATGREWNHRPAFDQDSRHPVVNVTAGEATEFCAWLTQSERGSRIISETQSYRLPTNVEWDLAAGVEAATDHVRRVTTGASVQFPWGRQWPPPKGAGNYNVLRIEGAEDDGFRFTAPVGSFAASSAGLFDLGGNAAEWTVDRALGESAIATLRGGSWMHWREESLQSSSRITVPKDTRTPATGFRMVLDDTAAAASRANRQVAEVREQRSQLLDKAQVSAGEMRDALRERAARRGGDWSAVADIAAPGAAFENSLNIRMIPLAPLGILLSEHEVRISDFRRFLVASNNLLSGTSRFRAAPDHPVTQVSWNEAQAFCLWLTRRERTLGTIPEDATYRLPTLAEWQTAVREGKPAAIGARFAWGPEWPAPVGFANLGSEGTQPVKTHAANALGFYDLVGNAAEWCLDSGEQERIHCGGSFESRTEDELLINHPGHVERAQRSEAIGFRIALEFRPAAAGSELK